jgi:hypothetical protein
MDDGEEPWTMSSTLMMMDHRKAENCKPRSTSHKESPRVQGMQDRKGKTMITALPLTRQSLADDDKRASSLQASRFEQFCDLSVFAFWAFATCFFPAHTISSEASEQRSTTKPVLPKSGGGISYRDGLEPHLHTIVVII